MQWPQRPQCISHNFYTLQSTQWPIEPYEQKWEDYQKLYSSKSKIVLVKIFSVRNKKSVDMYFVYVYVLIIMPKEKQMYYKSKENIYFFNYPLILLRNNKIIFSVLFI